MSEAQSFTLFAGMTSLLMLLTLLVLLAVWEMNPPRSRNIRRLIPLAFAVPGIVLVCFAAYDIHATNKSTDITVEGKLVSLQRLLGRGSHSLFRIQSTDTSPELATDYSGFRLHDDELIRATYLQRSRKISTLTILDGSNAGWTWTKNTRGIQDIDGIFFLFAALSFYVTFSGFRNRLGETSSPAAE